MVDEETEDLGLTPEEIEHRIEMIKEVFDINVKLKVKLAEVDGLIERAKRVNEELEGLGYGIARVGEGHSNPQGS